MPIAARATGDTYEARVVKVQIIIGKLHSIHDQDFIHKFIFDLCQRYLDKSKELEKFVRPDIESLERRYIENLLKDLGYGA